MAFCQRGRGVLSPLSALLFGRIVDARLRPKAAYFLHKPESQNNMRGAATDILRLAWLGLTAQPLECRLILHEHAAQS